MARSGRRSNGAGSVTVRKDGRYSASIMIEGKRHEFTTKTAAEGWARIDVVRRDADQAKAAMSPRQTVKQFLTFWLAEVVKPRVSEPSYVAYEQRVRLYLVPALGSIQLARLTPQHVLKMQNDLLRSGKSASHVRYVRLILKMALRQADDWGLIARNVVRQVDPPREEHQERAAPGIDEARRLIEAVRGTPNEAVFTTAILLGLRSSELRGLRWSDIDMTASTVSIRYQLVRGPAHTPQWSTLKTKASRRTLPLIPMLAEILQAHRTQQTTIRLRNGDVWQHHDLVFCDDQGLPIAISTLLQRLNRICASIGLPRYRVHDLRHACATFMAHEGVPLRTAMEVLGHKDARMTQLVYTHAVAEDKQEAMVKIGDLMCRQTG